MSTAPSYPEGCTPTDARVLREANHKLAQENWELRALVRDLEWSETGYDEGGNLQLYCPACGGSRDTPFRGVQGHRADCEVSAFISKWDAEENIPSPTPSTPRATPWKDHNTAELINALRDRAIKYYGAGQLRAQLADLVHPLCDRLKAFEGVTWQKPAMWQARVRGATTHPDHAWREVTPTKEEPTVELRVKYLQSLTRSDGSPMYEFRALFSFDQIEGNKCLRD